MYLALGKKQLLLSLMRQNSKYDAVFQFMSQDFTEQDNKTAASKNAFRALTKRKYDLAAGFFLLAGMLPDAVNMCFRHMNDPQLAIVLCRLMEGDQSPLLKRVVRQSMIPFAEEKQDVYVEYIALQLLRKFDDSVYVLLSASGRQSESKFHPSTSALLRLIDHSKSRLYAVPKHLINAAERKAAAVYAQQGMGLLRHGGVPRRRRPPTPQAGEEGGLVAPVIPDLPVPLRPTLVRCRSVGVSGRLEEGDSARVDSVRRMPAVGRCRWPAGLGSRPSRPVRCPCPPRPASACRLPTAGRSLWGAASASLPSPPARWR